MNEAIIGIGSNIKPQSNVSRALCKIEKYFVMVRKSEFITTKPIGYTSQPDFVNGVVLVETTLSLDDVVARLKRIEDEIGRVRSVNKYGPRVIDLDLLIWNGVVVDDDVVNMEFLKELIRGIAPSINLDD